MPNDDTLTPYQRGQLRASRRTSGNAEEVEMIDELLGDTDANATPKREGYPILADQAPDRPTWPILTKDN